MHHGQYMPLLYWDRCPSTLADSIRMVDPYPRREHRTPHLPPVALGELSAQQHIYASLLQLQREVINLRGDLAFLTSSHDDLRQRLQESEANNDALRRAIVTIPLPTQQSSYSLKVCLPQTVERMTTTLHPQSFSSYVDGVNSSAMSRLATW